MKLNSLHSYFLAFSLFLSIGIFSSCASTENKTEETTEQGTAETANTDLVAPTKFDTFDAMIEELGDYSAQSNTYEKIADTKIRISPSVPASADDAQIESIVKTSLITTAMRTFIHTKADEITIKVIPIKASMNPEDSEMMEKYAQEATITRSKAEEVAKQNAGTDLNSLVGKKLGDLFRADMANDNMEKLTSAQNLNTVFSTLTGK